MNQQDEKTGCLKTVAGGSSGGKLNLLGPDARCFALSPIGHPSLLGDDMLFDFWRRRSFPMLLFITHAKAGSTWVDGILRSLFGKQVYPTGYGREIPVRRGRIATAFMNRQQFLSRPDFAETQRFIVFRDLRDTFISRYFSLLAVHPDDPSGAIAAARLELQGLSQEEGMRRTIKEKGMLSTGEIQRSWVGSGEEILRYEDLITDDLNQFRRLFIQKLKLPVTEAQVDQAVLENRFERKYGRKLGEEDASSHGRKGTPGDWRNHFTPALAEEFNATYGEILLATGFETDPDWARKVEAPGVA
jgi:hypothetical protein